MDVSKLPKLSKTPGPAEPGDSQANAPREREPVAQERPVVRYGPRETPRAPGGAEAWISIGVGLILLLLTPNTLGYFSSKVFHTPFAPFPDPTRPAPAKCDFLLFTDGTKIYYRDSQFFWSDLVVTAFAITLILDGVLLIRARRAGVVLAVFVITVVATAANLLYLLATFGSRGLAITSALGVVFGGYIAMYQWNLYKFLRGISAETRN